MSGGPHSTVVLAVAGNIVSTATILASLAGVLPPVAAVLGIVWYLLQIWESPTIQKIMRRRSLRHRIRKRRARREETTDVQLS